MTIDAQNLDYLSLNEKIRNTNEDVYLVGVLGQRFIGAGLNDKIIIINGTPGNALGAYLNGGTIITSFNAQDAVGDTMNDGLIVVNGNIGDAAGYAMRGGKIYVKGNAGYRAGIHMKAYKEKSPLMIIGGKAGSFLGEYQAGGLIIVLGIGYEKEQIIGDFPCTGMHGGKLVLRGKCDEIVFPKGVSTHIASKDEILEIGEKVKDYCSQFKYDYKEIMNSDFTIVTPDSKNPYKQLYVAN